MIFLFIIIFWIIVIALAVILWRVTKTIKSPKIRNATRIILLCLFLIPVPGIHWYGMPIPLIVQAVEVLPVYMTSMSEYAVEGQLLDKQTKNPITGALVVVLWGHEYNKKFTCVHAQSGTSNDSGRFSIHPDEKERYWLLTQLDRSSFRIYSYKLGFEMKPSGSSAPAGKIEPLQIFRSGIGYMNSTVLPVDMRLKYLQKIAENVRCSGMSVGKKNLQPLYKSLYEEASKIAINEKDRIVVNDLCWNLARNAIEIDRETLSPDSIERIRDYMRKEYPECS